MKQKLKKFDEYDLVTNWRHKIVNNRTGVWKEIKNRLTRRTRRQVKQELQNSDIM